MRLFLIGFLLTFLAHLVTAQAAPATPWFLRPKSIGKMTDERAILVSVKSDKIDKKRRQLIMSGAGLLRVSPALAFAEAKKFENLKKVSEHIIEVREYKEKKELFVHTAAYNYHARMTMRVESEETSPRKIKFQVIQGHFVGMKVEFAFYPQGGARTLGGAVTNGGSETIMAYQSTFDYEKLPMPQFFVEFALEVVLKKVASLMRQFIEKEASKNGS